MKTVNWFGLFLLLWKNLWRRVLLNRFQYCYVRCVRTGSIKLLEGPGRFWFGSYGELSGEVQNKIVVGDGQYVVVYNPFVADKGDIAEGEREVRLGPQTFSLYPGESVDEKGIQEVLILTDDDALLVRAIKQAQHPVMPGQMIAPGMEVLVRGFCRFVPDKNIEIVERRRSLSLSRESGVYVQDNETGIVSLVQGERELFLEQNQSFWAKTLTHDEKEALGCVVQKTSQDTRALVASPRVRHHDWEAVTVDLEIHQAICLQGSGKPRVVFGPETVFLQPHERPRVLCLSGGVPVVPNVLKVAVLDLGPDFILDQIRGVRTKDNARLTLDVKLHWRFNTVAECPEKLFELKDPIGYAVGVIASKIRQVVANHDFEAFHAKACELIKQDVLTGENGSCVFAENGFEVFGIDVVSISAEDPEIQRKLTDAIKATVDIYTNRVREEAKLASDFRILEGQKKNEDAKWTLIEKTTANERLQVLEQAKTVSMALQERVRGEAEALRIKSEAELVAEQNQQKLLIQTLSGEGGERYLALEQARVLRATDKVVVPTGSQLRLMVGSEQ